MNRSDDTPPPHFPMPAPEVHAIELSDDPWRVLRWHDRVVGEDWCTPKPTQIDRAIGPEYRMWAEQL